ncbi:DNA-3-methyladenine glycosylase 2 family protein [Clostridium botulinum]|uniref:DNA-(apurinic or apyrimidinic site) lyase n=1 Tax=Clostridium botulinum (strain Okra / Type B1) TaxID=498213 RepID=B1IFD9_CLOBK|nr:DNA glycosylase [Clostridium botulinum]ACA46889.1 putative 8-oxoguanine DNA glycosylase [Clostridium botulinum B1 str. Okra]MBD5561302.1 DNA-3-methyladenine glycosylase 2 family protein [Clostridium botulinum]MBD5567398.1 DNA-3-methyladenine glycosylase 2 family protein [Clostridium botulinum]MBD5571446.1 DNA-3-methyladenine glycosylase 2 family protein [Clostridium botulinum]MBD5575160.1 DNA-3-methyladenine glycosylase 2 family protein [Clostridium botulinum]
MDFNYIEDYTDGIVIKDVRNFELAHIFECGQCFRWYKTEEGSYIGVAYGKVIEVEKANNDVILHNATEEDFKNIWAEYFDLYRDYSEIKNILSKDEILAKSVEFGHGIRLLKQDPFEIIVSFIISANNRIPMIKKAIKNISERWGDPIEYKGNIYYSFPTVEQLKDATEDELKACSVGFRAKYIKDTVNKIYQNSIEECEQYEKEYDMLWIKNQQDDICHKVLQNYSGIGAKVADCVMLFSMEKYSAFPVDVWVKRAMQYFYLAPDVSLKKIRDFGREKFGELSGFAQQYLFYYARENKIDVNQE